MKFLYLFALFSFFFLLALPIAAANSNLTIFDVKIKGIAETEEPVSVTAGETIPITATFKIPDDIDDIIVKAELTYSDGKITAKTEKFDVAANTTYVRDLYLAVPQYIKLDEESIIVSLEEDSEIIVANGFEYKIDFEVDVQKESNRLTIQDITKQAFFEAGEESIVTVIIKNIGSRSQNNVYAELSIPQLGILSKESVGSIEPAESEDDTVEVDLPLSIPENTKEGVYTLRVSVFNDNVRVERIESVAIEGVKKEIMLTEVLVEDKDIIKSIEQGKRATYKITILNLGTTEQTYSIEAQDAKDWGTIQIYPERITLGEDESAAVDVYVAANYDAFGEKVFTLRVKSEDGKVNELKLVADIKKREPTSELDPFVLSLIVTGAILFFIILLLIGLSLRSEYKRRLKAVVAVSEAKDLGRKEAKEEAAEIVSNIVGKVFDADEKHKEVAKERAAGRATRVLESLTGAEIEEVVERAIDKLSEKETKKKPEYRQKVISHIQDIIDKIRHRYGEKEIDDVIGGVIQRLGREEGEEFNAEEALETLEKVREKLENEIGRKK